jgi:hypothetical protein
VEDRQVARPPAAGSRGAGRRALALALGAACALVAPRADAADAGAPPSAAAGEEPAASAPPEEPVEVARHRVHREAVEAFALLDVDENDALEIVETVGLAPESFEAADRDRDGRLTIVEWVDARFAELPPATPPPAAPQASQAAAPAGPEAQPSPE